MIQILRWARGCFPSHAEEMINVRWSGWGRKEEGGGGDEGGGEEMS